MSANIACVGRENYSPNLCPAVDHSAHVQFRVFMQNDSGPSITILKTMERIATIALLAATAAGLYLLKTDQLSRIQASETEAAIAADAEMAAEAGEYTFVLSVSDTYGSTTTAESTVVIDDEPNGAPTAEISVSLAPE
jgi:hypothetical protein